MTTDGFTKTVDRYANNVLATIVGLLLIIAVGLGIYYTIVPIWVGTLFALAGLFLMFPMRVTDFIALISDKLPSFGKD